MWTKHQIVTALIACKSARVCDAHRKMILSGPAFGNRAIHDGQVTSKSPRLTNADFETFMAFIEELSPQQTLPGFSAGYFSRKSADPDQRLRFRAQQIANTLEITPRKVDRLIGGSVDQSSSDTGDGDTGDGGTGIGGTGVPPVNQSTSKMLLEPNGVGLAGWIHGRVTHGRTYRLADLDRHELCALIDALKAYGRRHGIVWPDERHVTTQAPKTPLDNDASPPSPHLVLAEEELPF